MAEKTALDRTHELLLELAKSNALWLEYPRSAATGAEESRMITGMSHGDYLQQLIEKVSAAYRAAEHR